MAEDTFLNRWDKQVREIPELNNLHQPDIGRSYPLPAVENGRIELRHFYHIASQTSGSSLYLGAPTVCAVLDSESGELLEMFPASELGVEPFEDMTYRLTNEQKAAIRPRIQQVKQLYDLVIDRYPDEPGGAAAHDFWTAFEGSVPPPLLPFYRALSPDFVAWCTA
jgi:hypothetical protein